MLDSRGKYKTKLFVFLKHNDLLTESTEPTLIFNKLRLGDTGFALKLCVVVSTYGTGRSLISSQIIKEGKGIRAMCQRS